MMHYEILTKLITYKHTNIPKNFKEPVPLEECLSREDLKTERLLFFLTYVGGIYTSWIGKRNLQAMKQHTEMR